MDAYLQQISGKWKENIPGNPLVRAHGTGLLAVVL